MTVYSVRLRRFCQVIDVPEVVWPWLDWFFEPEEIELVLVLAKGPLEPDEIAERLRAKIGQGTHKDVGAFLERAFRRGIVDKRDDGRYVPADFHARYDIWALFEGWQDVPEEVQKQLNNWEVDHYIAKHRPDVVAAKKSQRDPSVVCPEYVLLHEAEALIDRVAQVYLWPCNCRAMIQGCGKELVTCLRFTNKRGLGWEISKSRAKAILHEADRAGLMHSAEIGIKDDGTIRGAICNCCSDCCFPHLLAEREQVQKLWPLTRYVARRVKARCTSCGRCALRCPFGAFRTRRTSRVEVAKGGKGKRRKQIVFYRDRCRGCGICATGCPEDAIEMNRVPAEGSLWDVMQQGQAGRSN